MPGTILTDVKQMLGLEADYTPFDREIVMHINSVLMILNQLGVGTDNFRISLVDGTDGGAPTSPETWTNFLGASYKGNMEGIKSYVYTKVKLLFDPPASGTLMESYNELVQILPEEVLVPHPFAILCE